jgi:hypothetical protein
MASITRRKTLKGLRYKAEILIKEKGEIIHRESKTFSKKASAVDWAAERERELRGAGGVDRVLAEWVMLCSVILIVLRRMMGLGGLRRTILISC